MTPNIRFEWDTEKADANVRRHGLSFETAIRVFADPFHVSEPDRIEDGEQRWQTIGVVDGFMMLLVAHTWIEDGGIGVVRIISARHAERRERKRYEQ